MTCVRNQEILDVKDILAVGKVQYEDRMYFLDYQLSYTIVLASSRSMEPVELVESYQSRKFSWKAQLTS